MGYHEHHTRAPSDFLPHRVFTISGGREHRRVPLPKYPKYPPVSPPRTQAGTRVGFFLDGVKLWIREGREVWNDMRVSPFRAGILNALEMLVRDGRCDVPISRDWFNCVTHPTRASGMVFPVLRWRSGRSRPPTRECHPHS